MTSITYQFVTNRRLDYIFELHYSVHLSQSELQKLASLYSRVRNKHTGTLINF